MARQPTEKEVWEIFALIIVVAFPLWGIIWYITTAGGTATPSSGPENASAAQGANSPLPRQ